MTDTNFAARLVAACKSQSLTQQQLAARSRAHVTQIRRYEAGTSQRLKLAAVDQFTPEEQGHVAAFIEGALLRHHARQAFSGQTS